MRANKALYVVSAMTLATSMAACGQKAGEAVSEEIELAPLEEKKLAPAEEVSVVKQTDDSVGNMMVYPSGYDETGCLYGTNTLTFYFENEDVTPAGGLIYVYESPSGDNISSVSTDSASNVTVKAMDEAGKAYTGWSSGTKIDVAFSDTFEMGKNYYVILEPGCFKRGSSMSKSITNASLITFRVKDFGFKPFESVLSNDDEFFSLTLMLGGEAKSAEVSCVAITKSDVASDGGDVSDELASANGEEGVGTASDEDAAAKEASVVSDGQQDAEVIDTSSVLDDLYLTDGSIIETKRFDVSDTYVLDLSSYKDTAFALMAEYYDENGKSIDSSTFIISKGEPSYVCLEALKTKVYGAAVPVSSESFIDTQDLDYTKDGEGTGETGGIELLGETEGQGGDVASEDKPSGSNPNTAKEATEGETFTAEEFASDIS